MVIGKGRLKINAPILPFSYLGILISMGPTGKNGNIVYKFYFDLSLSLYSSTERWESLYFGRFLLVNGSPDPSRLRSIRRTVSILLDWLFQDWAKISFRFVSFFFLLFWITMLPCKSRNYFLKGYFYTRALNSFKDASFISVDFLCLSLLTIKTHSLLSRP